MKNPAFQELLEQLLDPEHCSEAVLSTKAGSLVAYARRDATRENGTGTGGKKPGEVAPYAAASIAASLSTAVAKLSYLLGEAEVDLILQRGAQHSIGLSAMPGDMVLVTVHGPEEGEAKVRDLSNKMVDQLLALHPRGRRDGLGALPEEVLAEARSVLDEIFRKAA